MRRETIWFKFKVPLKNDFVVPRLIIDSGVLFNPGDAALNLGAAAEFQKVANFIQNFSPGKIIIEGHTDSDGDEERDSIVSCSTPCSKALRRAALRGA